MLIAFEVTQVYCAHILKCTQADSHITALIHKRVSHSVLYDLSAAPMFHLSHLPAHHQVIGGLAVAPAAR